MKRFPRCIQKCKAMKNNEMVMRQGTSKIQWKACHKSFVLARNLITNLNVVNHICYIEKEKNTYFAEKVTTSFVWILNGSE